MIRDVLEYIDRGWPVFPLRGKKPLEGTHGVKDATLDKVRVCNLFTTGRNIGIACGEQAGITVVDIDGISGINSMKKLVSQYGRSFTYTPTVMTGSGFHLYYKYNASVTNHVRVIDGIDIRNDGGYVVAPPSVHASGKEYRWVRDLKFSLLDFPEFLLDKRAKNKVSWENLAGHEVPEGSRNSILTSVTGAIARGVERELGCALVVAYNQMYMKPPLDDNEVNTIINSVFSIEERRRLGA